MMMYVLGDFDFLCKRTGMCLCLLERNEIMVNYGQAQIIINNNL